MHRHTSLELIRNLILERLDITKNIEKKIFFHRPAHPKLTRNSILGHLAIEKNIGKKFFFIAKAMLN